MRSKIKLLALFLCLLILFVSCDLSGVPYQAEDGVSRPLDESQTNNIKDNLLTAEEWLKTLQSADFGGYSFTIATSRKNTFVPQEEQVGKVDPVLQLRNDMVEDKYNIKIVELFAAESEICQKIERSLQVGEYYADIISISGNAIAWLASDNLVMNLHALPFFDLSAAYLNEKTIAAATGRHTIYALFDSVSLFEEQIWSVFYNKKLLADEGLTLPPQLYKDGEWTWERLASDAEIVAKEVMEKRSPDKVVDIYGYGAVANTDEFITAAWISGGMSVFGGSTITNIDISLDYSLADKAISAIKRLTGSKAYLEYDDSPEEIVNAFIQNRLAFMVGNLETAMVIAESGVEWGLMPLPQLLDTQGTYYSYVSANASAIAVPLWQANSNRTGMVLNALCAASYEQIPNAIKVNYMNFSLQDNTSSVMMNRIIENPTADLSTIYADFYARILNVSKDAIIKAVNGTDTLESLINRNYADFIEFLKTNFK